MDNKYKRLLNHSVWNFAGNAGSKIISFLLLPFYTKWLGTEGYGFSDLISTYSTLFGGLVTLCVSDAILIFVKDKPVEEQKNYYSSSVSAALFLSAIWCFLLFVIKSTSIVGGFIINNLWFIISMIITNFLQTSSQQMALALNKIKIYSFSGLVQCLTIFGFSLFLIPKCGIEGYVYSMILANIVTATYSVTAAGSWRYFSIKTVYIGKIKELFKFSVPLIPNTIMWWLVSALNRPLMESNLGLSAVGIYAVAQKFPGIITLLFTIFAVSWSVSVIEEYGKPQFEDFYKKIFRTIFCGLTLCSLLLMLFSKTIIAVLTDAEFHEAYRYMVILIIGSVFSCMSTFWGTCFGVVKQTKYSFYSSVWGAMSAIILNIILIPRFHIYGAAISVVLSFAIMALSRYFYSKKFVKSQTLNVTALYTGVLLVSAASILFVDSILIQIIVVVGGVSLITVCERDIVKTLKYTMLNKFSKR